MNSTYTWPFQIENMSCKLQSKHTRVIELLITEVLTDLDCFPITCGTYLNNVRFES